jgi:hypothetical protein
MEGEGGWSLGALRVISSVCLRGSVLGVSAGGVNHLRIMGVVLHRRQRLYFCTDESRSQSGVVDFGYG